MTGMLAAIARPESFASLAMICPSPCYLNFPPDYMGGFEREDLEDLLDLMDQNYIGWANYLAPLVMGELNDPDLVQELSDSFCSSDPIIAKTFARATFFSDHRQTLSKLEHPTLILQSEVDSLASIDVGRYMQQRIKNSQMRLMKTNGHCIHMTDPMIVFTEVKRFLDALS
jgi:sigma-B regulation protein RsbQ